MQNTQHFADAAVALILSNQFGAQMPNECLTRLEKMISAMKGFS